MPDVTGLFDSFLEAAVSLAVLFVIVAWVSSKIVELGQLTFNVHGKMLRDELERCFGEESGPNKGRFTRYFYWHPMIVPLTQPSALVSLWRKIRGWFEGIGWIGSGNPETHFPPGRLPGHIAPESFAAVVMNPFPWPTTEEALRRQLIANLSPASPADPAADPPPEPPLNTISDEVIGKLIRSAQTSAPGLTWNDLIARLELGSMPPLNPQFLASQVDIHAPVPSGTRRDPAERYVEMCRSNDLIPHPLETRIITLLRDADNDLDEFRGGLRRWYAEAMARVTGRFKRMALIWVFVVALIICTLFNLNAINLFSALMASPELRAAGVAASQVVGTRPGGIEALSQKMAFTQVYPCVPTEGLPDYDCQRRLLSSLWRDSRKVSSLADLFPEEDPKKEIPAKDQVAQVQGLCIADSTLCTPTFRAKQDGCMQADENRATRECTEAWSAIWTSSGFFWHPEAAHKLALSLAKRPPPADATAFRDLLARVQLQAKAEAGTVVKFLGDLPNVGPVWNDKKLWKSKEGGTGEEFDPGALLWSLFGVLLSAALAALGAPFWYDVLGKLSRRGTSGARGEKT